MLPIRVIFDGKAFVPQQPVTRSEQSEAIVIVDQTDPVAQARLDTEVRAYYQSLSDSGGRRVGQGHGPATEPRLGRGLSHCL